MIDYYRKEGRKKEINIDHLEDFEEMVIDTSSQIFRKEEAAKVNSAILKLSDKYQKIIHLKFFAEFSTKEIAEAFEITDNNARVMFHRAVNNFNQIYGKIK